MDTLLNTRKMQERALYANVSFVHLLVRSELITKQSVRFSGARGESERQDRDCDTSTRPIHETVINLGRRDVDARASTISTDYSSTEREVRISRLNRLPISQAI